MRPRVNLTGSGHADDLLGVDVGGLLAGRDQAVAGLELDVAAHVERAVLLADERFLAGDDEAAAVAVVDDDLDAVKLGLAFLVGGLAFELDADVLVAALQLDGVAALGLVGDRIERSVRGGGATDFARPHRVGDDAMTPMATAANTSRARFCQVVTPSIVPTFDHQGHRRPEHRRHSSHRAAEGTEAQNSVAPK